MSCSGAQQGWEEGSEGLVLPPAADGCLGWQRQGDESPVAKPSAVPTSTRAAAPCSGAAAGSPVAGSGASSSRPAAGLGQALLRAQPRAVPIPAAQGMMRQGSSCASLTGQVIPATRAPACVAGAKHTRLPQPVCAGSRLTLPMGNTRVPSAPALHKGEAKGMDLLGSGWRRRGLSVLLGLLSGPGRQSALAHRSLQPY